MQSIFQYIIKPLESRYKNTVKIGDSGTDFIVNTDVDNFKYISREALVLSAPSGFKDTVPEGSTVIVHHNIFRRWYDVRANERNSFSYVDEEEYICSQDQIYMYKKDGDWVGFRDYCFVSAVENDDILDLEPVKLRVGIIEVDNDELNALGVFKGDTVRFTPSSEYEFVVDGRLMYRMRSIDIYAKETKKYKKYKPEFAEAN